MAILRETGPYIYPTWLPKLLAGLDRCEWKIWFQVHHDSRSWDKLPSDFDLTRYNLEHTELVCLCTEEYEQRGFTVSVERQNGFRLKLAGIYGGGKSYRPPPSVRLSISLWKVRWMFAVEMYARVRRACMVEGMSVREASRVFGLHRDTVRKMLAWSVPPGYRRQDPPRRPRLEPFTGVIDAILEADRQVPRKQRHTAKRIFERLRDEHGFDGGYTTVKDYVREHRRRTQEMFVPLSHPPGHAQCDFGEAVAVIAGVERKVHYLVLDLPHSDGCFMKAYPAETTEAFLDGHVSAFAFLGGVPQSILYDNTKLAVARILGDGRRQRTRSFTELQSHHLFEDRFGRPGKGNDKGKVEGMVGYVRRNFLVPVPSFQSFDALNAHLEQKCLGRMDARLRGHDETIGQRMERDLEALLPLPAVPYDACDQQASRVSSLSLVRYKHQRLLGAGGLRTPGRTGEGLRG